MCNGCSSMDPCRRTRRRLLRGALSVGGILLFPCRPCSKHTKVIRHLADFVLIWGSPGQLRLRSVWSILHSSAFCLCSRGGDDVAKSPHMARIANSASRRKPGAVLNLEVLESTGLCRPGQVFGDLCAEPMCRAFHLDRETKRPSVARRRLSSEQRGFSLRPPKSAQETMKSSLLWKLPLGSTTFSLFPESLAKGSSVRSPREIHGITYIGSDTQRYTSRLS